ncbi:family 43 glycosylhydrolase [Cohnella hashimotonis]|uniref:Family 43 glycosylhydrolase n=1 Tax=Cohnella hashimotonis TaxID=2826895 RepID=A0ABT6TLB5_9BACL|nr:family 43 glycosylhydrolase [Cohnella hashimotonis]MDI4647110.1 family 43 glycosylhydrolase [Cohnella hashimotonis]
MKEYNDCRNPVLPPNLCIPDPEAHVMPDGRVYVYGSWDQEGNHFCSREYRVISSENMIDWTDHGVSFDSSQVSWVFDDNAPKYSGSDPMATSPFMRKLMEQYAQYMTEPPPEHVPDMLFAPDAINKGGKYYLYFCMSDSSEGVAVADKPEGPFSDPVQLPCGGIDPAVFIDDDGQAYFYWGQFQANGAKLTPSMVDFEEGSIVNGLLTEEEHYFHEGSSIRKRGDIYYFVYSCMKRGKPTSLAYATSDSPLGPFQYRGIIVDNDGCDPASWNNHGSIEEVNGQWYVFYHRSSRNSQQNRRLCIEPIFFNEDGTISEVHMTSQGAGRPFSIHERIEAYRACQLTGNVYIGPSQTGRESLIGIKDRDEAVYRYVEWESPATGISIEGSGSGEILVFIDGEKDASGRVVLNNGIAVFSTFQGNSGRHEIRLQFNECSNLVIEAICFGT